MITTFGNLSHVLESFMKCSLSPYELVPDPSHIYIMISFCLGKVVWKFTEILIHSDDYKMPTEANVESLSLRIFKYFKYEGT